MPIANRTLTVVRGVRVGQAETPDGSSGVTAVLFDTPAPTVVDVRGGASATYDTASLSLDATFGRRWAIFLSGGSLYGLDAARGVRTRILEMGGGHRAFENPNPVVPITGAALFDLPMTRGGLPDYLPLGYEAARVASRAPVRTGRVGAGAGATVGKYLGRAHAMRGGTGSAGVRLPGFGALGVLVAVNAVGAVRDPATGHWVAAARGRGGRLVPPGAATVGRSGSRGTTLAIVVTEATLDRPNLARLAAIVHAGLSAAIRPFHSSTDGDVLFAASTERLRPRADSRPGESADRLGLEASRLAVLALLGAVRTANRLPR
ncbi:MAG TPA: P1 family peptidase [Thermoplasmata archaeon]|nr:P1 family peptidase [Thermoplasmata archaeon]